MGDVLQFRKVGSKAGVPTLRNAGTGGCVSTSAPVRTPDPVAVEMRASGFETLVLETSCVVAAMLRDVAVAEVPEVAARLLEIANAFDPEKGGSRG